MITPFEQPAAPIERRDEPASSPFIPGKEYATGETTKGSGEKSAPQTAETIGRALGVDPQSVDEYQKRQDV